LSIAEPKPIEHHRDCGLPYTHASTGFSCLFIKPLGYSRFLTHPGHDPQMIQTLCLVLQFLRHFLTFPLFPTLLEILFSFNPSVECGLETAE